MKTSIRVIYRIIGFFMIVLWMAGCSKRSENGFYIGRFGSSLTERSYLRSKSIRNKEFIKDQNVFCDSLNKDCCTSSNRHVYNSANKGSYSSYFYKVQPGDTLFYIAWITNNDYRFLAKQNNIRINDILKVGQILEVGCKNNVLGKKIVGKIFKSGVESNIKVMPYSNVSMMTDRVLRNGRNQFSINKDHILNKKSLENLSDSKNHKIKKLDILKDNVSIVSNNNRMVSGGISSDIKEGSYISWVWPTVGTVISTFSSSEGGNKGIDISGSVGQPVFSAGSGKVVYTGDALFGYGNLIIIKHDHNFLSTYAHNDKILVVEQQNVVLGQKIATMGSSGSDIVKLHFEIRCKGRSVDPLYYLPKK